jgi:cyclopropane-fatty-acyl-phospholipid synthase
MAVVSELGASKDAISRHYDVGNDFFALILGSTLCYSSALFSDDVTWSDNLDLAQLAKIDWHLKQCGVGESSSLLDIGCGWGGLLERAATVYGARRIVGLTLSEEQAKLIRSRETENVEVQVEGWASYSPRGKFNAITSIGAFEHFAKPDLDRETRISIYRSFFKACHELLLPGGVLSLQTIAFNSNFDRARYNQSEYGRFVIGKMFPESDLPTLDEILAASNSDFEIKLIRNDRRHYAATLAAWLSRLERFRGKLADLVGAEKTAEFERLYRLSRGSFQLGNMLLLRLVFEPIRRPPSGVAGRPVNQDGALRD